MMPRSLLLPAAALIVSACGRETVMTEIPPYPTATELVAMLDGGETSSVAIVEELIERAREAEHLNAYITLDADGARARAQELDALRRDGTRLGPLHGLPLVVKDNIHVEGLPNTAGTPGLAAFRPQSDSPVVAALRAAGAIVLAKANMHELAFGITSDNAEYGAVANPFDPTLFAGGSSGGTAAAVAAGLAPAGLGTDTGGSVRIPAALTGVVGFRPSTGRYDTGGVTPISHTRDTIGLIAAGVADLILLDGVISAQPHEPLALSAGEIRLGVPRGWYFENLDRESAAVIDAALRKLDAAGVTLIEADPADIGPLLSRSAFPIALYEVARDLPAYLDEHGVGKGLADLADAVASPDVRGIFAALAGGEGQVTEAAYADALAARAELRAVFRDYFAADDLDAMVFPTTLLPARPIANSLQTVELNGERVPTFPTYIHNTDPASIAALPGISLPAGLTAGGLPVGIEMDGPEGSDARLLAVAAVVESILDAPARPGWRD